MAAFLHRLDTQTGILDGATPLDFDLDGGADLAFVDNNHQWYRVGELQPFWAPQGYLGPYRGPNVPGDYNGNGTTEPATITADGTWETGGPAGDIFYPPPPITGSPDWVGRGTAVPVPGDYDGDGATEPAWYDGWTGTWHIHGAPAPIAFGVGDEVVGHLADAAAPGDYDGDGTTDIATYSPLTRTLSVLDQDPIGDLALGLPMAADLDGDGADELAVFDPRGTWQLPDPVGTPLPQGDYPSLPMILSLGGDGRDEPVGLEWSTGVWLDLDATPLGQDARATYEAGGSPAGTPAATVMDIIRFTWLIDCLTVDWCDPDPWG